MARAKEYRTTLGQFDGDGTPYIAGDPEPPGGVGWTMCGSAIVAPNPEFPRATILWFWVREA